MSHPVTALSTEHLLVLLLNLLHVVEEPLLVDVRFSDRLLDVAQLQCLVLDLGFELSQFPLELMQLGCFVKDRGIGWEL